MVCYCGIVVMRRLLAKSFVVFRSQMLRPGTSVSPTLAQHVYSPLCVAFLHLTSIFRSSIKCNWGRIDVKKRKPESAHLHTACLDRCLLINVSPVELVARPVEGPQQGRLWQDPLMMLPTTKSATMTTQLAACEALSTRPSDLPCDASCFFPSRLRNNNLKHVHLA